MLDLILGSRHLYSFFFFGMLGFELKESLIYNSYSSIYLAEKIILLNQWILYFIY